MATTTPTRWNDETQVNTSDTGSQSNGQAVALPDGGYLVVWLDFESSRIVGQRYDALDEKVGGERLISPANVSVIEPEVIRLSDGKIAIAYVMRAPPVDKKVTTSIQVDVLDSSLHVVRHDVVAKVTEDVGLPKPFSGPALTPLATGGYEASFTSSAVIKGVSISAGGSPVAGSEFQYGTNARNSELATLKDGTVIGVAQTRDSTADTLSDIRIDETKNGNTIASLVMGAKNAGVHESAPDVAALKGGGFVVVWTDGAMDGDGSGIGATVYGNSITKVVNDGVGHAGIAVNTKTIGNQHDASVVGLQDGGFLVAWSNDAGTTNGEATGAIMAQRFDAHGDKVGKEFLLSNTCTALNFLFGQEESNLVLLSDGRVALNTNHAVNAPDDYDVMTSIWDPRTGPIMGTPQADVLTGRAEGGKVSGLAGKDVLFGSSHKDRLDGGDGKDKLDGLEGADKLIGGKGNDKMSAGDDNQRDVFIYQSDTDSGHKNGKWDHIFQFDTKIGAEAVSDAINLKALGIDWSAVSLDSSGPDVKVSIDTHGSPKADMVIEVMGVAHLHQADFIL